MYRSSFATVEGGTSWLDEAMTQWLRVCSWHKLWYISHVYVPCINTQNCLAHPQIA
jgi:hypothetical protein